MPQSFDRLDRMIRNAPSSARVLHLGAGEEGGAARPARPIFADHRLNAAILVKHRRPGAVSTRLLLPLDPSVATEAADQALVIGQPRFDRALGDPAAADLALLRVIDALPTLDLYILREHLARHGLQAAADQIEIDPQRLQALAGFMRRQLSPLIRKALGEAGDLEATADLLISRIFSHQGDRAVRLFQTTLKLDDRQYAEGMFCWSGFLYFKFVAETLLPEAEAVQAQIAAALPFGACPAKVERDLKSLKVRLGRRGPQVRTAVRGRLDAYDRAYGAFTQNEDAVAFREFLLAAPQAFAALAEDLAALQHMVSDWRSRVAPGSQAIFPPHSLVDVLTDFSEGLGEG